MESVQQLEQEARQERQNDLLPGMPLGPKDMASIRREAISRALVEHGLLLFRRRRSTLPLKRVIWANVPQGAHGRARIEIPLALNELEGAWELCFTDAATSVAETVKVKVKTESGTRQRAL
ncbi:MAG: hypothetical protein NTW87_36565 [Planctomycetota bacterium]|nr:hypothetical protein [Planctomycetota bacterium]